MSARRRPGARPAARVLVAGIGSPFGDDRAGWAVVRAAEHALGRSPGARAIAFACLDRPGAALAGALAGFDAAILADAMRTGAPPGTVRVAGPAELAAAADATSSHGFGVAEALGLAAAVGMLPRRIALVGIEADPDATGEALSPAVDAAIAEAVAAIVRLAGRYLVGRCLVAR